MSLRSGSGYLYSWVKNEVRRIRRKLYQPTNQPTNGSFSTGNRTPRPLSDLDWTRQFRLFRPGCFGPFSIYIKSLAIGKVKRMYGMSYLHVPKSPVGCETSSSYSVEDLEANRRYIVIDVQRPVKLSSCYLRCFRDRRSWIRRCQDSSLKWIRNNIPLSLKNSGHTCIF